MEPGHRFQGSPRRAFWVIGLPVVAGCGLVLGYGVFMLVWIALASANLIHGKGLGPGEEPRFFDDAVGLIFVVCLVLGVLLSLHLYARIWRRHREAA